MMQLCIKPISTPQEIPSRSMETVAKAISHAWKVLTSPGFKLCLNSPVFDSFSNENDVTDHLVTILNAMVDDGSIILGFSSEFFQTIEIGSRQPNSDYTDFGNQPDFVIRPMKRPTGVPSATYGIYVECKTIDETRGVNLYITQGVKRFVDERYAWSMTHGLMLGYVLNNERLPNSLNEGFSSLKSTENKLLIPISPARSRIALDECEIHETQHTRQSPSASIRLDHIWLIR